MTAALTYTQRVGAFMLKAGRPVYLREIIRATRLTKNQAAGVLTSFMTLDLVEALDTAAPARRFIVRQPAELQARVDNPGQHGGGIAAGRKPDFGPLLEAMGPL